MSLIVPGNKEEMGQAEEKQLIQPEKILQSESAIRSKIFSNGGGGYQEPEKPKSPVVKDYSGTKPTIGQMLENNRPPVPSPLDKVIDKVTSPYIEESALGRALKDIGDPKKFSRNLYLQSATGSSKSFIQKNPEVAKEEIGFWDRLNNVSKHIDEDPTLKEAMQDPTNLAIFATDPKVIALMQKESQSSWARGERSSWYLDEQANIGKEIYNQGGTATPAQLKRLSAIQEGLQQNQPQEFNNWVIQGASDMFHGMRSQGYILERMGPAAGVNVGGKVVDAGLKAASPFAGPLAPVVAGAGTAVNVGSTWASRAMAAEAIFQVERNSMVSTFAMATDSNGKALDGDVVNLYSNLYGATAAGLEYVSYGKLAQLMPGKESILKGLGPGVIKETLISMAKNPITYGKILNVSKSFALKVGEGALTEGITEALQEITSIIAEEGAYSHQEIRNDSGSGATFERASLGEMAGQVYESGRVGALTGGGMVGVGSLPGVAMDYRAARKAQASREVWGNVETNLNGPLKETFADNPEGTGKFIAKTQFESQGYTETAIDAKTFKEVLGSDYRQYAQKLKMDPQKIEQAAERGQDVKIPIAKFLETFGNTPYYQPLTENGRLGDDAITPLEADDLQKSISDPQTKANLETSREAQEKETTWNRIYKQFDLQISQAGRPAREAEATATLLTDGVIAQAAKVGMTPEQYMAARPMVITKKNDARKTKGEIANQQTTGQFMEALGIQESSGDYNAVNTSSGASGKYQIMPENWPEWSKRAGLEGAPQTPENQETVTRHILQGYHQRLGSWKLAAVAWYAGEQNAQRLKEGKKTLIGENGKEYSPDAALVNGPSVTEYANQVVDKMKGIEKRDGEPKAPQLAMQDGINWSGVEESHKNVSNLVGAKILQKTGLTATISSGYRDPGKNSGANGAGNSWHLQGKAVDLVFDRDLSPEEAAQVERIARQAGFQEALYHDAGSGLHLHLANLKENASRIYGQPITEDVDLDESVNVLDLTSVASQVIPHQRDIFQLVKDLSKEDLTISKEDLDLVVSLPTSRNKTRHIAYAQPMAFSENRQVVDAALNSLVDLVSRSVLVEVSPVRKKITEEGVRHTGVGKGNVDQFYRFFVPVRLGRSDYTLMVTAEESAGNVSISPKNVSVYQITPFNKKRILATPRYSSEDFHGLLGNKDSLKSNIDQNSKNVNKRGWNDRTWKRTQEGRQAVEAGPSALTVRDILAGIKDAEGAPYVNEDGTGNFGQREGSVYNQDNRGQVEFTATGKAIITLLKKRDASTVIHESGHVYLENMARDVLEPGATEELKVDFETIKKWLGVAENQKKNGRVMFTDKQHEKFADGFERYLAEGKAPSSNLKKVFRDFKRWMLNIYKNLGKMQEITPEVRDVFDRLLATEDQIAEMREMQEYFGQKKRQMKQMLDSFGDSKVEKIYRELENEATSEAEEALAAATMKDLTNERKKWLDDRRKSIQKEIADDLKKNHPVYRVLDYLENAPESAKIKPGSFEGDLATYLVSEKGEMTAEDFANFADFASIEEMAMAFAETLPLKDMVTMQTNQEMATLEAGILGNMEEFTEASKEALYNDRKVETLAAEVEILGRTIPEDKTTVEQDNKFSNAQSALRAWQERATIARNTAEAIIGGTVVREITPRSYVVRARLHAGKAMRHIQFGRMDQALKEKDLELLNAALANEAYKALKEQDKMLRDLKRLNSVKADIGFTEDYVKPIRAMIQAYQFVKTSKAPLVPEIADLSEVVKFMERQAQEKGFDLDLPDWLKDGVAPRQNFKDLPMEKVRDVYKFIKRIEHLGKSEGKGKKNQRFKDFQDKLGQVVETIFSNLKRKERGAFEVVKPSGTKDFFYSHSKIEFLVEKMDGYEEMGTVWRAIFEPLADAGGKQFRMMEVYRKKFKTLLNNHFNGDLESVVKKEYELTTPDGKKHPLTGEMMLSMALNWGNEGNRDRLLQTLKGDGITKKEINAFFDENMTEAHWKFVQDVWALIDGYWPDIASLYKEWTGATPEKVLPAPIATKYGVISGGYFPIAYDPTSSKYARMQAEKEAAAEILGPQFISASTRNGHTKARTGYAGGKLLLNLEVIDRHITNVIQDLSYGRAVVEVNQVISNGLFEDAVKSTLGLEAFEQFRPWLVGVARPDPPLTNWSERVIQRLRMGTTAANMAWKVTTALVQPLGATMAVPDLGAFRVAASLTKFYKDFMTDHKKAQELIDFVKSKSHFMAERASTFDRDVADTIKSMKEAGVLEPIYRFSFHMASTADLAITIPLWNEAYTQGMSKFKGNEVDAIRYADKIIRQTQGSGNRIDLAGIQRGSELKKMMTMHYSFFNVLFNTFGKQWGKYRTGKIDFVEFATAITWVWFIQAALDPIMKKGLGYALNALSGEDDDFDMEEFLVDTGIEILKFPLGSVVYVRDIANAIGPSGSRYAHKMSPVVSSYEAVTNMFNALIDGNPEKFLKNAWRVGGTWYALPVRQTEASVGEILNWLIKGEDFSLKRFILGGQ